MFHSKTLIGRQRFGFKGWLRELAPTWPHVGRSAKLVGAEVPDLRERLAEIGTKPAGNGARALGERVSSQRKRSALEFEQALVYGRFQRRSLCLELGSAGEFLPEQGQIVVIAEQIPES